nr:DUF4362 domain-containing protein [Lysinibacillus timonensis]
MKKLIVWAVLFVCVMAGCNSVNSSKDIDMYSDNELPPFISLPEDIVDMHGELKNEERVEEFFIRVQQGKDDSIRVVKYTTEGAPILYEYNYDGDWLQTTIDTSRDGYGSRGVTQTTCTTIEKVETNKSTDYLLEGCEEPIEEIVLSIDK